MPIFTFPQTKQDLVFKCQTPLRGAIIKNKRKKGDLCQFPAIFMREKEGPLIGQAAHGRRAGIILLTAWPIRGPFFSLIKMAGN